MSNPLDLLNKFIGAIIAYEPKNKTTKARMAHQQKGNCDHQPQLCCDLATAATPPDGVFGSDRWQNLSGMVGTPFRFHPRQSSRQLRSRHACSAAYAMKPPAL